MISAVYDCAAVEKKMRHLEAAIVLENVDSSHGIHGPRSAPSTETTTSAMSHPMGPCNKGRAGILRKLGLPSRNPPRPIGE